MGGTNSKEERTRTDVKLFRPGDPRVSCLAILCRRTSELKLVSLGGGSSSSVKISDHRSRGIVNNDGEVYAVTKKEILKLRSDGTTEHLAPLPVLKHFPQVVSFQKKIYIIRPRGKSMLCFNPADNSLTDDLPGCGLSKGFCVSATDDFICAMGGMVTPTRAMKFDPLTRTWDETAPMRKGRTGATAATLDGKIHVMGGLGWLLFEASVEYYNPGNNSWTEISNMNVQNVYCKRFRARVVGDRLYTVGAVKKSGKCFVEVYDENKWTAVTKFQIQDGLTYSCFWPHGSHQPEIKPEFKKDLLKLKSRLEMAEEREAEAKQENALLEREKSKIEEELENLKKQMKKGVDENKRVTSALAINLGDGATVNINSVQAGDKGSQENTDHSVTAGKAIYGQSTSESVGENITVHRTGK